MGFLNKYKLLHENQSGFRQNTAAKPALIKLIDDWMKCIDNEDMVVALFLDFRKAFDLVDHSILVKKLSGVFIDENRTWSSHIDQLCALISSKISLLKQLSDYVPVGSSCGSKYRTPFYCFSMI